MDQVQCHISLRNHRLYIHVSEQGQINCFKYNDYRCEWDQFSDLDSASDWMFAPMDPFQFRLVMQED